MGACASVGKWALFGSIGSVAGAFLGLSLPTGVVEGLLGVAIMEIVVLMLLSSRSDFPEIVRSDPLAHFPGLEGAYVDQSIRKTVEWRVHRTPLALAAGWANVPALNLLLGAPLRVAVATSGFVMTINGTAATWISIDQAAILPLIAVPSVVGMMIGTRVGAQLRRRVRAPIMRLIVIGLMALAEMRSLIAGILGVSA